MMNLLGRKFGFGTQDVRSTLIADLCGYYTQHRHLLAGLRFLCAFSRQNLGRIFCSMPPSVELSVRLTRVWMASSLQYDATHVVLALLGFDFQIGFTFSRVAEAPDSDEVLVAQRIHFTCTEVPAYDVGVFVRARIWES